MLSTVFVGSNKKNTQSFLDEFSAKIYENYAFWWEKICAKIAFRLMYAWRFGFVTPETEHKITAAVEELTFSAIQKSVNFDPFHPKVYSHNTGSKALDAMLTPGGRYCYDNPDVTYWTIPIHQDNDYIISGLRYNKPAEMTFSLIKNPNSQRTVFILTDRDIKMNDDGKTYEILVSGNADRYHHNLMKSNKEVSLLFVRYTVGKWEDVKPDVLSVKKVYGPLKQSQSEKNIVRNARRFLWESIFFYIIGALGIKTLMNKKNYFHQPEQSNTLGTLVTQASSFAYFKLKENEAMIVTVFLGNAAYFVLPVTTFGLISVDPARYQSSLNNFQADRNPDGSYTFVISKQDLGIYNWIDTVGMTEGTVMARWQNFSENNPLNARPSIHAEVVCIDQLYKKLPPHIRMISKEERNICLKERFDSYHQRIRHIQNHHFNDSQSRFDVKFELQFKKVGYQFDAYQKSLQAQKIFPDASGHENNGPDYLRSRAKFHHA
jgi:hypothetical protein